MNDDKLTFRIKFANLKIPYKEGDTVVCTENKFCYSIITEIHKIIKIGETYTIQRIYADKLVEIKEFPYCCFEWNCFTLLKTDDIDLYTKVLMKKIGYDER